MRVIPGLTKGVNLGGWLSQVYDHSEDHFDTYITEEDIRYIASLGMDHVRVPVDYMAIEDDDGRIIEEGYSYLDICAEWCGKYGLRMIIDLHKAYGYTFDPQDKEDKALFFKDDTMKHRFYDLWRRIASRYCDLSDMVVFELLNEIVLEEVKDLWNDIALKTIEIIRKYAPDNWILFGGVNYNSVDAVKWLPDPADGKVGYIFHCYEPFLFTHQGAQWVDGMPLEFRTGYPKPLDEYRQDAAVLPDDLKGVLNKDDTGPVGTGFFEGLFEEAVRVSEERDIPLYCSEYGVIDYACIDDALRWVRDIHSVFERLGIGRALWNYKGLYFGNVLRN